MAAEFLINGRVTTGDGVAVASARVQAFDRDLPSIERSGGNAPALLGEARTDVEGRFQITYASKQFSAAEGATTADVSFRVVDTAGAELAIRVVRALDREYRGDEVIFNVPNPFNVEFTVESVRQGAGSEYELLVAAVSPLVEPLLLTEIADDDVAFVASELGYDAQGDSRQRLEWLRRSALLAAQSSAPTEAFYGWARMGLPAQLGELVGVPVEELPRILAKLSSLSSDRLRDALFAAVEENIISAGLRNRAGVIAVALHRRAQQPFTLRLSLRVAATGDALSGYAVSTTDIDRNNTDLGADVTDSQGQFTVTYFDDGDAGRAERERNLRFRVRGPQANDAIEITQPVNPTDDVIAIAIPIAGTDRSLQTLRETAGLDIPDDLAHTLRNTYGIENLADIRRRGGLHRIAGVRKLNSPVVQRLDALADLDRLCKDVPEANALIDRQYNSVLAITDTARAIFVATIGAQGSPITPERAVELHIAAKAQTGLLDQMFAGVALDIAAGLRPQAGVAPDEYSPLPQEQDHV